MVDKSGKSAGQIAREYNDSFNATKAQELAEKPEPTITEDNLVGRKKIEPSDEQKEKDSKWQQTVAASLRKEDEQSQSRG